MARIGNGVKLSQMSIPGTHDTMSHYGGDIAQTQSMSLATQLNSGIRALDIRCRHQNNMFQIHHGIIDQRATFDDVMKAVTAFLAAHPGETVLMRVKEEYDPKGNSRSFEATFADYYAKYPGKFWKYTSDNPTLGEVRGKIVLLQNFTSGTQYGIKWSTLDIQDDFSVKTNWDLEGKWNKVAAHMDAAKANGGAAIYVNFLSASGGSFPYFIASGHSSPGTGAPRLATGKTTPGWKSCCKMFPRVSCALGICTIAFEGTNILYGTRLLQYNNDHKGKFHTGIVMADFPGYGLIQAIVSQN
jgi:1-phosphatidylinositol phosphodiesterase